MTVSTGAGPAERNINEAVANRERNASQENAKAELQTSTTGSTRQASSPGTRTGSSDGDSGSGTRAEQRRAVQEPQDLQHPRSVSLADCLAFAPGAAAGPDPAREGAGAGAERQSAWQEASTTSEDAAFTVMIRQIPRHYTQLKFLADLSCRGFYGLVDFIYFPFDVKKGMNVGYGFLNFTEPRHTELFQREFDNAYLDMEMWSKEKPLRMHPAAVQGFQDNYSHFMKTKTGQKADRRYSPLFMPGGSWAGLAEDIRAELAQLREAFASHPPGRLGMAPGGLAGPTLGLEISKHIASADGLAPGETRRTGLLSASALESHDVAQRDLGAALQARGRDLRAEGPEDGGRAEQAPAPCWDSRPAKISPSSRLLPPPGLQPTMGRSFVRCTACGTAKVAPDSMCPRCWPRAPLEPSSPAPRRPQPPEGQFWPPAEPEPLRSHRTILGHAHPAESSAPAARGDDLMGAYQQLEEQRQRLLDELVAVQEEQRRAIMSATSAHPSLPPAAFQFDWCS